MFALVCEMMSDGDVGFYPRNTRFSRYAVMLDGLRRYFWDRRRKFAKYAGIVGGLYFVTKYVLDRLEEIRDKAREDRLAKDK